MKLQDQVCTLEQAKRLKELGVNQDSHFSWFGNETPRLLDNARDGMEYGPWLFIATTQPVNNQDADHRDDTCTNVPIASAFTVVELGELIGPEYQLPWLDEDVRWTFRMCNSGFATEAQARAAMLIYLLENKMITL